MFLDFLDFSLFGLSHYKLIARAALTLSPRVLSCFSHLTLPYNWRQSPLPVILRAPSSLVLTSIALVTHLHLLSFLW